MNNKEADQLDRLLRQAIKDYGWQSIMHRMTIQDLLAWREDPDGPLEAALDVLVNIKPSQMP